MSAEKGETFRKPCFIEIQNHIMQMSKTKYKKQNKNKNNKY